MCNTCRGTGYIVVEVPVFADGGYSDVDQVTAPCKCNPDPTEDDFIRTHGVPDGLGGYIDFAELGRLDREMERQRDRALSDLGEPPMPEYDDATLPAALLA